jgi:hypothetical protein
MRHTKSPKHTTTLTRLVYNSSSHGLQLTRAAMIGHQGLVIIPASSPATTGLSLNGMRRLDLR